METLKYFSQYSFGTFYTLSHTWSLYTMYRIAAGATVLASDRDLLWLTF